MLQEFLESCPVVKKGITASPALVSISPKSTPPLPFWVGCKTVDMTIELSDGTVTIIQMSAEYARVVAKAMLKRCDQV